MPQQQSRSAQPFAIVILGAGKPAKGETPAALIRTSPTRRVLDWTIDAFRHVPDAEIHFVGGYRMDEVVANYPGIRFVVNPRWRMTGNVGSLILAPLRPDQGAYVCYADVVFTHEAVQQMDRASADVVVAIDLNWKTRYPFRSDEDMLTAEKVILDSTDGSIVAIGPTIPLWDATAEFAGVLRLSPQAVQRVLELAERGKSEFAREDIPWLIGALAGSGLSVQTVDVSGNWAELDAPEDLARFVLGTKAETLERLRPLVRESSICDQVRFTVAEWQSDRETVLRSIRAEMADGAVVVRSSTLLEDGWSGSNAGAFQSILDVPVDRGGGLAEAIDTVIASYSGRQPADQILVQPMVRGIRMGGVVMTRTLGTDAPYYTINYDATSGRSDTVTGGTGEHLQTIMVHRDSADITRLPDPRIKKVLGAVRELEGLLGHDALDVEFVVDRRNKVHVLQVRPIPMRDTHETGVHDRDVATALHMAAGLLQRLQRPPPHILGGRTFLGVMPDWNPAEIIGRKPRRLALSLYQYLIMDEVWATQRAEYGYRDVRPCPLLVDVAGLPYVDVRATFNSFVPADLPDSLAERLMEHYLDRLQSQPYLHDKVEFDIVFTCLTLDFDAEADARLRPAGFGPGDIEALRDSLKGITVQAIRRTDEDLGALRSLEGRLAALMDHPLDPLDRAYCLLEDCRRFGTLPFSHLARSAFVAVSLLRSLERSGITTAAQTEAYLNSVQTVAKQLDRDGRAVANGAMGWEDFLSNYGHLRPGTYDIMSSSYMENPERYLFPMVRAESPGAAAATTAPWDEKTRRRIAKAIQAIGLSGDVDGLDRFIRKAIEGREYAKFVFSKNLSIALDDLRQFGAMHGLTREQVAHIRLKDFMMLRAGIPPRSVQEWLRERAEEGRDWHEVTLRLELPPVIFRPDEIFCFELPEAHPNFVTQKTVVSEVVRLDTEIDDGPGLDGKIVLIPQADPGYDWLFGHGIAGLVTMYGGANSHMTVRAAEMGIPAAVGAGERLFERLAKASVVELDCQNRLLRVVR